MPYIKKLAFAPLFLISLAFLFYFVNPFLKSTDIIFSLSLESFYQIIILSLLLITSGIFYVLFATCSQDWKYIIPVSLLASILPLFFVPLNIGIILAVSTLAILILTFSMLEVKLKTYLTFQPAVLLSPSVRQFTTLLIFATSFVYFLSINNQIQTQGFQIPESLIDTAIQASTPTQMPKENNFSLPEIPQEQLEMLKQNPQLLSQFGLDANSLDQLIGNSSSSEDLSQNLIKNTVKDQLNQVFEPYLPIIPIVLAVLFFLTLQSITAFLSILISPLFWATFKILEKTGFVKFATEMREVRKLVV